MTTAERWQRVKEVLHSALQREPEARAAFLTEACTGDEALRTEVDSLLVSQERADRFFEMPVATLATQALAEDRGESLVGRMAGPYKLLSQLGAGGMGDVYLAEDLRLGRKVALKLLPSYFTQDADRLRRFQQEASAASRLNHPNILTIYDVGQFESTHYIATEYIEGVTLRDLLRQKQISTIEALDIVNQAASALASAHAAGIVHRDIKPENIMLRPDGYLKVLDFGLAKLAPSFFGNGGGGQRTLLESVPGMVMGTVTYMSPEQARGFEVDARSDIWSLGVVLYEMVVRRVPFEGASVADVIAAILEREVPPLPHDSRAVPPALEGVIRKALAKNQQDRYSRIEDLAQDVRTIKEQLELAVKSGQGGQRDWSTQLSQARAGRHVNNLSAPLPTIIGRASEIAEIEEILRQETTRLLTLTGAGGTGKTRLGQQVARNVLDEFDDGVFFVPLAPINDHNVVAAAIAQILGVQETSERALEEGLKSYLRDKKMLLVLDNFEHVTSAAPLVAALLSACPQLKVLVTSRALLHIGSEHEFRVPPLALPQSDAVTSAEDVMRCGAAALFVQRVLAVRPNFAVTNENAQTIAQICIQLDGLPLALELAAVRTKLLSLEEMLARMSHRLKLLKGGARDLPTRQQTMQAAIAWSYDLLEEDEKTLCRRQSVFFGGSTLRASEAVCSEIDGAKINVLDGLESLLDESLVLKKEMSGDAYRFLMLETIREYALEHLEASGEAEALRRKHAHYFLELVEEAEPLLMSARREPSLTRLEAEHNNLRAALRWAVDNGEVQIGLRLVGALRWFWYHRGHFGEGYQWAMQLLAMPAASARTRARAKALSCAGSLAFYYSAPAAACPLMEESVAIWRELGDNRYLAHTLTFTSLPTSLARLDFPKARAEAEESVRLFRDSDDTWGLALSLTYAGVIMWTEPACEKQATDLFSESVALFRELGDDWGASGSILYLGAIQEEHGDAAAARSLYEEFVTLTRESKDAWRLASGLDILAELLRSEGQDSRAEALTEESLILQRKLGRSLNLRKAWAQMKKRSRDAAGN